MINNFKTISESFVFVEVLSFLEFNEQMELQRLSKHYYWHVIPKCMHDIKIKNPKLFIQQSFEDKSKLDVFSIDCLDWSTENPLGIDLNDYRGGKIIVTSPHGG